MWRGYTKIWEIAPDGMSGARCYECGTYATIEAARELSQKTCPSCGQDTMDYDIVEVSIRDDALIFMKTPALFSNHWWHITHRKNWMEDLFRNPEIPMVHIGTHDAAIDRLHDLQQDFGPAREDEWFLYELSLVPGTPVSETIKEDANDSAPRTLSEVRRFDGYSVGVTRYVNRYEAVGTISLLANPRYLNVVAVDLQLPDPRREKHSTWGNTTLL